jgi:hypothetical protein
MKSRFLIWIVFGLYLSVSGQELMTIGEVFNFEINDEFHFRSSLNGQPPNADRITIIDKYFSQNGDTVNYVESHNSYWTNIIWEPEPYLEYHFWTDTATVKYYDLDSSLIFYEIGFQFDTNIFYSEYYCDSLVNWCQYYIGPPFEPDYYRNSYGRGIGLVGEYMEYGGVMDPSVNTNLFYYKKNGIECGMPDTTTVGINDDFKQYKEFESYPNPAKDVLFIDNASGSHFQLFSINGLLILESEISTEHFELKLKDVPEGMYFLRFEKDLEINAKKIIVQHSRNL